MSEKNAYNSMRKGIIRSRDRICRIETFTIAGMFDVNACLEGVEIWIEIKAPTEPKRISTPLFGSNHKITLEQRDFALAQVRAGGNCYFYIDTSFNRILMHGTVADEINKMTLMELIENSIWHSKMPTSESEWGALREHFLTPMKEHNKVSRNPVWSMLL